MSIEVEHTLTKKKQTVTEVFAKIVRALTVPPLLVSILLIVVYALGLGVFTSVEELILSLVFLVFIPLCAYPLALVIPSLREKGREGQRNTAFLFSLVGYVGGLVYGIAAQVSRGLLLIFITYLVSVVALLVFNKLVKTRASGHACGTTGPLIFFVYFTGAIGLLPSIIIAVGVVWSSLYLKRHTALELLLGAVTALVSFALAIAIIGLI